MKVILLIMIGLSMLHAEFTKSGDIVTDSVSGLEWQDDAVGASSNWEGALQRCEALSLGGHGDWRLPNVNELESIVDITKVNPAIVDGFENTSSSLYWSSSTYEDTKSNAWVVYVSYGYVYAYYKNPNSHVRCVREGQ